MIIYFINKYLPVIQYHRHSGSLSYAIYYRRKSTSHRKWIWELYFGNQSLPIHEDIIKRSPRLKSRKSTYMGMRHIADIHYDALAELKLEWEKSNPDSQNLLQTLGNSEPRHQLLSQDWVLLNHILTWHVRCKGSLYK